MIYNQQMTAEEIIKQSVEESKLLSQKKRRAWVRKMLNYYGGNDTASYIKNYFNSSAFQEVPPYTANFTRRFINKMSRIYTVGTSRNVNSKYDLLTVKKDARFKHVERMTRLVGTIATQIILVAYISRCPYCIYSAHFINKSS